MRSYGFEGLSQRPAAQLLVSLTQSGIFISPAKPSDIAAIMLRVDVGIADGSRR